VIFSVIFLLAKNPVVNTTLSVYYSDDNTKRVSLGKRERSDVIRLTAGPPVNFGLTLVAGLATAAFGALGDNGPATSAQLNAPRLPWVDANGNIYIPDCNNYKIRKVSASGIIVTFAGIGTQGSALFTGPATSVNFYQPTSVVGDRAGTFLYISDEFYVWKYVFSTGIISVFAGTASRGFTGDNGPASSACLNGPSGLWLTTSNDLFLVDKNNHAIRRIASSGGILSTVAGILGSDGYSGDGGPATAAKFSSPNGLYVDTNGKIFIADQGNNAIRVVFTNGTVNRFAGGGPGSPGGEFVDNVPALSGRLWRPSDVKGDSIGNIFIADHGNVKLRVVDTNGIISTLFSGVWFVGMWIDTLSNLFISRGLGEGGYTNSILRSVDLSPTSQPSGQPSKQPTTQPTSRPTLQTRSFQFTGTMQTFVVPAFALFISVDVIGAVAGGAVGGTLRAGFGARVQATFPVTPGTVLYIFVGGRGGNGACSNGDQIPGGWNGGGFGYQCTSSGGGASDVRMGGTSASNRIIVAGGGGGCYTGSAPCATTTNQKGGDGGLTGGTGTTNSGCNGNGIGGGGGNSGSGGSAGSDGATAGTLGQGGNGCNFAASGGGGGGGGYFGGTCSCFKIFTTVFF
jgi:hypothetical protein